MHLLSASQLGRLKANKKAFDYFARHEKTFKEFANGQAAFASKYSELNEESRVVLVKTVILELDKSIWGLKTDWMSAEELAELYARCVVGHEQ